MTTHVPGSADRAAADRAPADGAASERPADGVAAEGARPEPPPAGSKTLLDADEIGRSLSRIAHEIIERNDELDRVALVGIQTRGVPLASRLRRLVAERSGFEPAFGTLDITFHRDDVHVRDGGRPPDRQPVVRATSIPFDLEGATVVLVDDVLYTGRTIRAAIDALLEFGRPSRVQLAVLVDRGHRELPIRPDYVGKNLPTARDERIQVELLEVDEVDRVLLLREPEDGARG
jgi:pyrimidine operon attenuation protein / uracil phosphoribosyltransferase